MFSIRNPQMGIVIAAPSADAIIFAMNFERSTGFIHTAVNGRMAGHEAPKHRVIKYQLSVCKEISTSRPNFMELSNKSAIKNFA